MLVVRDSKSVKKLQFRKKELSTSVDRKAARNQHQSQQIGWENLVKSQKWRLQSYQDRRGIKGFFSSLFEVHLQISKKDPELNQQKVSWSLILIVIPFIEC